MGVMTGACRVAADDGLAIYLYGSTREVLDRLVDALCERFPGLVAGAEPSRFRRTIIQEKRELVDRIHGSGAAIMLVGLGGPRQEVFAYEYRDDLSMPVIAVGAALDYLAGTLLEPHPLVRRIGLEWLHRLIQEPRRLWNRYTVLNARFQWGLGLQLAGLRRPDPRGAEPPREELRYG
jgi:N-acetylglucosaminyldiphosphoundecaprenol N-acetyl-beta-D-mannosaminyltransferase